MFITIEDKVININQICFITEIKIFENVILDGNLTYSGNSLEGNPIYEIVPPIVNQTYRFEIKFNNHVTLIFEKEYSDLGLEEINNTRQKLIEVLNVKK